MFDLRSIPGETEVTVDWNKLQNDLKPRRGEPSNRMGLPMYPVFEVAVWELTALKQLLAALDERYTALEKSILLDGIECEVARQRLEQAEGELRVARTEFLEAFHRLNFQYGPLALPRAIGEEDEGERRVLEAIKALWDMEAAWRSHRVLRPGQRFQVPEARG